MTALPPLLYLSVYVKVIIWLNFQNTADGVRASIVRTAILTTAYAIQSLDSIKPVPPDDPFRVDHRLDSVFDYFYLGSAITPQWKTNCPAGHQVSIQPV